MALKRMRIVGHLLGSLSPKPLRECLFLPPAGSRVDRRRADARVSKPPLRQVEWDARLQGPDAKGVTQAARRGSATCDLAEHHHPLDEPPRGHAVPPP